MAEVAYTWFQNACGTILTKAGSGPPGSQSIRSSLMWDNGAVLTFGFLRTIPGTVAQQAKVRLIKAEWERHANIRFNYVAGPDVDKADIRITFDPQSGSWSYVGKQSQQIPPGQATMNFASVGSGSTVTIHERGVVLHEFGHFLGLDHEHHSISAEGGLTGALNETAAIAYYTFVQQGWTADDVRQNVLDTYETEDITNYISVDERSIMKYFMPAEMNAQGHAIPPNHELSDVDKALIFVNYPFPISKLADTIRGMDHALDVLKVTGSFRISIIDAYIKEDWQSVRTSFTAFIALSRAGSANRAANPVTQPDPTSSSSASAHTDNYYKWCSSPSSSPNDWIPNLWAFGSQITYSFLDVSLLPGENMPNPSQNTLSPASDYRKERIRQVFSSYRSRSRANLNFMELPSTSAHSVLVRISFGTNASQTSWSQLGSSSATYVAQRDVWSRQGGTPRTSLFLNDSMIGMERPTTEEQINKETSVLFHEIGHVIGLGHVQLPNDLVSNADNSPFDTFSIMFYSGDVVGSGLWDQLRTNLDWGSSDCNIGPSQKDSALLGIIYPKSAEDDKNLESNISFATHLETLGFHLGSTESVDLVALRDIAFRTIHRPRAFPLLVEGLRHTIITAISELGAAPGESDVGAPPPTITKV